ncbi:MAG: sensor histidine kinase [Treponema sp.]|nr:sensor histidine kinase [Treponema sp.]
MSTQNTKTEIYFNFSYFALRLLGKGLYSNAWTAIAELVANGFDANANNVKIYINATNKEKSVIEIFDDGYGMGYDDLEKKYTLIGKDKRDDDTLDEETRKQLMGRKGIGKLAALYLSKKYYLISKTKKENSAWCLNSLNVKDSDVPRLDRVDSKEVKIEADDFWNKNKTGTMIKLTDVDLRNFGVQSLKGLKARLSDFFLVDSLEGKMEVAFLTHRGEPIKFERVEKEIAYKNMYALFDNSTSEIKTKLSKSLQFRSDVESVKEKQRNVIILDKQKFSNISGERCFLLEDGTKTNNKIPYNLEGWIGIHSTIDKETATKNDPHYLKNKVYNPNQLRLYVRNKLAVENFLDYLQNTQAFSNYIEGEISFDVLDDDRLPDIATSNRQGFDEDSDRVQLLIEILKPIVGSLIRSRVKIGEEIKKEEEAYYKEQERIAKEKEASERKRAEQAEQAQKHAESERDKAYCERNMANERADLAEIDLHSEKKRNSFLMENLSAEQLDFAKRLHQVGINLNTINDTIETLTFEKNKNDLSFDELWDGLKDISYYTKRIESILSYAIRAKFNTEDETINADLFAFISDYCNTIINKKLSIRVCNEDSLKCQRKFSPQDIGVILDNIESNSRKAQAKNLYINIREDSKFYILEFVDDGTGLDKKKIADVDSLFEFGKGFTENGSGVGLYHIKNIVEQDLRGYVAIDENYAKGFKLIIGVKNEE